MSRANTAHGADGQGARGDHVQEVAVKIDPRYTKRYLKALTAVVAAAITALDAEMKRHSDAERGRRIAHICNGMELSNDLAKRFGLGIGKKRRPKTGRPT